MARMRFEIELAPEAKQDLERLTANLRAQVKAAMEAHLRHDPTRTSKSRIKRLRGLSRPEYRLRVGGVRVFYDVSRGSVQVLAIVMKADADAWLEKVGKRS
jgi:mRNA-degrading endonuclease RelE of RelBE toxin-antitoxin system